jgi:AraC-like DNA-binding protein
LPLMDEEFTHWFSEARRTLETARGLPIHVIKHRVSEIILWLRHQGFHLSASRTNSLDKQILAMVNRNPSGEWSVAKLADMLEISESTLRRRLAALGVKPKHLILNARMSNAIGLLQSTDLSVAEIASKVGYESSPRFASRFRSRFGFAPSELRGHRRGHPGNGATPNVPGRREN